MADRVDPAEVEDLELAALQLARQIRYLSAAVGSLSPLTDALAELRAASARLGREKVGECSLSDREDSIPLDSVARGFATSAPETHDGPRFGEGLNEASGRSSRGSLPDDERYALKVTVVFQNGPADLVRVYHALQTLSDLSSLNLLSYSGGRAEFEALSAKAPDEVPLQQAIASRFPEGAVVGEWVDNNREYQAVVVHPPAQREVHSP